MRKLAACVALFGALVAGEVSMAASDVIRGSATYRERMALPAGATLEVELLDISKADAPALVISSETVPVLRQVPIPFSLTYDAAAIDPQHSYVLTARLVRDGETVFRSAATTPVLTGSAGGTPEILLVQSSAPDAAPTAGDAPRPAEQDAAETPADMAAVAGSWIAEEINGSPAADKVVSWLRLGEDGRAQGQGGCNSYTGTYKLEDGVLTFGPLASTRRACPEPQMSQEERFFAALAAVKAARLEDDKLVLADLSGDPLVRLHKK